MRIYYLSNRYQSSEIQLILTYGCHRYILEIKIASLDLSDYPNKWMTDYQSVNYQNA